MTDTNQLREAFEARMTDDGKWPAAVEKGRGGAYLLAQTENAWTEWEACAEALQARAQVQGEPFGYIHHFVAHDDSGVIIDTTWEADGCADAMPHPTHPAAWVWSHATPFYTTPQPAQATQAEVTDEQINAAYLAWCKTSGTPESFARAILALRTERVPGVPDDVARHIVGWWLCNEANPQDGSPWTTEPSQRVLDHMKVVSGEKHTVMRLVAIDAAMLTAAQAQKGRP